MVLAALELAISHNRWHVTRQLTSMPSAVTEDGLVDRLLIEMSLDKHIAGRLRYIESEIKHPRRNWHERIADRLSEQKNAPKVAEAEPDLASDKE